MCRWRAHVYFFFSFSSVSLDTPLTEVFLGSQRPRKILFVFKRLVAVARMGKHLAKPDATPCSSLNNQSPFSEMKTEVCNDVMDCYKPKTEPVPVPRKSISEKKTSHTFLSTGLRHRKPKMVHPKKCCEVIKKKKEENVHFGLLCCSFKSKRILGKGRGEGKCFIIK